MDVLVVDNHPAIVAAIRAALEVAGNMSITGEASTQDGAMEILRSRSVDSIILELSLPDAHGLNSIEQIRSQYPRATIVVYTRLPEDVYAERSIRCGANGFVSKNEGTQTLVEVVRRVSTGEVYLSRNVEARILRRTVGRMHPDDDGMFSELTDRELEVVEMLGQGLTTHEIANRLNIVEKHAQKLRWRAKKKLGFKTVENLMRFAMLWFFRNV